MLQLVSCGVISGQLQGSQPDVSPTPSAQVAQSEYVFHYTMTSPSPTPTIQPSAVQPTPPLSPQATMGITTAPSNGGPVPIQPVRTASVMSLTGTLQPSQTSDMESSTAPDLGTTVAMTTEPEVTTIPPIINTTYNIAFEGNCTVLKLDDKHEEKFKLDMKNQIVRKLNINESRVSINNITCGSVNVSITLSDTRDTNLTQILQQYVMSGNLTIVVDTGDNNTFEYTAREVTEVLPSGGVTPEPSVVVPATTPSKSRELDYVDKIIITVVCIVAGICILVGFIYCCYECRKKKYSQSFTLGKSPGLDSMQDFTLTKMRRPQPVYNESGIILSTRYIDFTADDSSTDKNTTVVVLQGESPRRVTNGHVAPYPGSSFLTDIEEDEIKRASTENLVKSVRPPGSPGYDNPSFSSDDILDSGTEADAMEDLKPDDVSSHNSLDDHRLHSFKPLMDSPLAGPSGVIQRNSLRESPTSSRGSPEVSLPAFSAASSDSGVPAIGDITHSEIHSRSPSHLSDGDPDLIPRTSRDYSTRPSLIQEEEQELERERSRSSSVKRSRSPSPHKSQSSPTRSRTPSPKQSVSSHERSTSHSPQSSYKEDRSRSGSPVSKTPEQSGIDLLDAATREYSEKEVAMDLSGESRDNFLDELNMTIKDKIGAQGSQPGFDESATPF